MGPGYFPIILSILMILLGLVIAGLALRGPTTEHSFGSALAGRPPPDRRGTRFFGFALRGLGHGAGGADRRPRDRLGQPLCRAAQFPAAVGQARRLLCVPVHPSSWIATPDRALVHPRPLVARGELSNIERNATGGNAGRTPIGDFHHGTVHRPRARLRHVVFNLMYCFIGVLLGTAVSVLPGLGPIATIAMLLPISAVLPPVSSLIMLAGIYYGAQYGGSTTAI